MHWSLAVTTALFSALCLSPPPAPEVAADEPSPPAVLAQDDEVVDESLALPPGHPPLDEVELPPGHPPLEGLFGLPPGHPPLDRLGLPQGHPPIGACPYHPRVQPSLDDVDEVVPIPAAVPHERPQGIDI